MNWKTAGKIIVTSGLMFYQLCRNPIQISSKRLKLTSKDMARTYQTIQFKLMEILFQKVFYIAGEITSINSKFTTKRSRVTYDSQQNPDH